MLPIIDVGIIGNMSFLFLILIYAEFSRKNIGHASNVLPSHEGNRAFRLYFHAVDNLSMLIGIMSLPIFDIDLCRIQQKKHWACK